MRRRSSLQLAILCSLLLASRGAVGSVARLAFGHVQENLIRQARHLGRHNGGDRLSLAVSLNPRDSAGLSDLLKGLYDPADPLYHQFLSADDFRSRFAPKAADVAAVSQYFELHGFHVNSVSDNNMLLNIEGTTGAAEAAFRLELHDYLTPDGRIVFAPTTEPLLQGAAAESVMAVTGLSTFTPPLHPHLGTRIKPRVLGAPEMTPSMIQTAYGTGGLAQTGAGETLALAELDGYVVSDITTYGGDFGITVPPLQNVLVSDGVSTPTGTPVKIDGRAEVTLDIELAMAMAQGLSKIIVYEANDTQQGALNVYNKIAADNLAKEVSSSWGLSEDQFTASFRNAENVAFQQMAAQGQSMFAASADRGAYDNDNLPTTLVVDDPASQPFVTGVGGTSLTADTTTGAYGSETTWSDSGGGISHVWSQPSWQNGLSSTANKGTGAFRMVPDVSLDGDPNTGFAIYVNGGFEQIGGTSCAAPLWAAFTALVNQGRVANGLSRLGFANPTIYRIGESTLYTTSFNDIADNSTNLFYPAVTGYDLASGWGTIKGAGLFFALTAAVLPPLPPASLTLTSSLTKLNLTWPASSTAVTYNIYRSATGVSGSYVNIGSTASLTFDDTTAMGLNFYEVTAVNATAESIPSTAEEGSINESPPAAPSGLNIGVSK